MKRFASKFFLTTCMLVFCGLTAAYSASALQSLDLPDGSKIDLSKPCPVCEMKLEPGPNSPAAVVFNDGTVVGLDANSDFFKYVLEPEKYKYSKNSIKSLFVKAADIQNFTDARKAYFTIVQSDSGEMGFEITAFTARPEAEKLAKTKDGARVLAFNEVTLEDLQPKKKMLKMKRPDPEGSKSRSPHSGH